MNPCVFISSPPGSTDPLPCLWNSLYCTGCRSCMDGDHSYSCCFLHCIHPFIACFVGRSAPYDLLQICGGSKYVCPFWICPIDNLISQLRTSFSINEILSNKYDTHRSTINKRSIERITWRRFYTNQTKTPKNNNWWINNLINNNNWYRFNCSSINE